MHGKEKIGGLPRWPAASVACVLLVIGWIVGAVLLGDYVRPLHWAVQAVFYPIAGFAWVFPVRWLMLWGAYKR